MLYASSVAIDIVVPRRAEIQTETERERRDKFARCARKRHGHSSGHCCCAPCAGGPHDTAVSLCGSNTLGEK